MKKTILILGAALVLAAGCERQGGTSDQYGTDRGASATTPMPRERNSSLMTNDTTVLSSTNQLPPAIDQTTNQNSLTTNTTPPPSNP